MKAEEFYKNENYPILDKFDKRIAKFDYYDMINFAEYFHQSRVNAISDEPKHCCQQRGLLKDKEVLSFEDWIKHNYKEGKYRYYSLNGLNCLSYEEVLQKYNVYKQTI